MSRARVSQLEAELARARAALQRIVDRLSALPLDPPRGEALTALGYCEATARHALPRERAEVAS